MNNGTRHRLTGTLSASRRGYLMECDNGDIWVIEFAEGVEVKLDQTVTVEGAQVGYDRILADWTS